MADTGDSSSPRKAPRASGRDLLVVILAAGQGRRMHSATPKVLHSVGGQPMLQYSLDTARQLGAANVVVVHAPGQKALIEPLANDARLVVQGRPLGTGHAVNQVPQALRQADEVLVLYGDQPLVRAGTARRLLSARRRGENDAALLAVRLADPGGYGRVLGDDGDAHIVEEKDAAEDELAVDLVNTGIVAFRGEALWPALRRLKKSSRTGEYYLTQAFGAMPRRTVIAGPEDEALGVNDRWQLAAAEAALRSRKNRELAESGVTIVDPATTYIDTTVKVEPDAVIEPFTFLRGSTTIGARTRIGPFAEINDCNVGQDCVIGRSHLEGSTVEDGVDIGPFNRLRAGSLVARDARVGSFAEIKNTLVGPGSDVHHFSYLGDAVLGKRVNIGAGTVTANYDGEQKTQTEIGDRVFIGSDSILVAPVKIGDDAYTAAGSVITRDVEPDTLAIERAELRQVPRWSQRKRRKPAPDG
ncbi:MAG TPA: bifunctional UDP-N-acetylglucosamine diphosphorylase/glucosamine-1-phosphate N-acetyltransferase GlmU [Candidatus Dormibacteraeota bacterium]|jgi:bifunctional UDP-N-acetylglucosamine pyrophosphorylase/glucosamine-1-phosphate N-acetyltransferase|nr:bifunctional UDP-N-acetylglucosamine diphosphorylase/glucosamine-1-phosphate N-acetyltransferase GlmU [Candidatus Dormibacteraeota bacterium]